MIDELKLCQLIGQIKEFVTHSLVIGVVAISLLMISCQNGKTKPDYTVAQKLEVKTFSDTTIVSKVFPDSEYGIHYELGAEVDFPIDGSKPLTDSIKRFVAMELYSMFDMGGDIFDVEKDLHIPFEKVCKWNDENIVLDFINHYRPLYEKHAIGAGAFYLTLKLASQTETFITYYKKITYCAASCNHEYKYYTFRKTDGLLLEEMVSDVNLRKFVKKYPQYEIDENILTPFFGLSGQGLLYGAYVETGASRGENHIDTIPYNVVRPYLTEEVQELVQDY